MLTHTRNEDTATGLLTYRFSGRIDGESSQSFHTTTTEYKPESLTALLLDLEAVDYISSAGLREVLKLQRWCSQQNVSIAFSKLSPAVSKVFEIAAILPADLIFESNEAAEAALK